MQFIKDRIETAIFPRGIDLIELRGDVWVVLAFKVIHEGPLIEFAAGQAQAAPHPAAMPG